MGMDMMASVANYASLANSQGLIGIKMFGMAMEGQAAAAASIVSDLANMPPPAGVGEIGGLLDIRV